MVWWELAKTTKHFFLSEQKETCFSSLRQHQITIGNRQPNSPIGHLNNERIAHTTTLEMALPSKPTQILNPKATTYRNTQSPNVGDFKK